MGIQINGNTDNISATDGGLTISDLEINQSGISTFNGNIDANGDLDVDGHTNLDNVSIAGVTTFAGAVTTGDHITLTGQNPRITFTDSNHNPDFEIYGSAGIFQVWDSTNSTHRLVVNSSGQILLGAGAVATTKVTQSGSLDLDSGGISLCIGGNENSSGRTNSTNKLNRVVTPHYTNAEEPMAMISGYSTSGASELFYGGGSGLTNAATRHSFYTAANTTTTSGTERIRVVSNGKIIVGEANTNPVNDFEVRRANGGGDVAIRIGNNTGTNAGSTASLYFTTSPTQNFNTAYIQAVRDGGRLNFGYSTNDPTVTMQISTNKVGITNTSPECRSGGIDMSSNDGTSGKTFTDMRGYSNLIIRNPNTDQHGFTQLLFENGGGTSAATMFRHRLGPSHGSQQNFVGDLCLFRRTGNAGGSNNDFRESTRFCGATEQARQIWWASGNTDTSGTNRLGWHHLSAERDHPGTDAYTFFRLETGAAAYARNGMGKYTCVWTTGHASGYGIAIGHFGYYMPHGSSTIVVNEHIIHRERYSNGSYYAWSDSPNLRIINNTASGGTNAAISFRCGGRRSSGFDLGVVVGLFIDLYVPESANGDSNPRLYVAGDSESNLSGGGHGNPVSHAYMSIQSSNPNHSGQP